MQRWKDENYLNLRPVHMSQLNQLLLTDCLNWIHFLAHRWSDPLWQNMDSFGVAQRVNIGPGTCHVSPLLAASLTLVPKKKKELGAWSAVHEAWIWQDERRRCDQVHSFSTSTIDEGDCIDGQSKLKCDEMIEGFWQWRFRCCISPAGVLRFGCRNPVLDKKMMVMTVAMVHPLLHAFFSITALFFLFFLGLRTERRWILGFGNERVVGLGLMGSR